MRWWGYVTLPLFVGVVVLLARVLVGMAGEVCRPADKEE